METNNADLLNKPIWQMTGEEFLRLNDFRAAISDGNPAVSRETTYAYGIVDLSRQIGCCQSTIYSLKKEGILDAAIVSNIGRKIIFDVEKARELANEYQIEQRNNRREERLGR